MNDVTEKRLEAMGAWALYVRNSVHFDVYSLSLIFFLSICLDTMYNRSSFFFPSFI